MTSELIEKFYSGKCSEEEKQGIIDWFRDNPVELENYFSELEWKEFRYNEQLDTQISAGILSEIHKKTQKKAAVISLFKKVAIAASVALLLGIGWMYLIKEKSQNRETALTKAVMVDTLNNTKEVIDLVLPDSSLVQLQPGGRMSFQKPFAENRRDIFLSGEALFDVTKDLAKPFTVYSDEIATTVLGTKFTVSALPGSAFIKVRLLEGRVVVKPADSANEKLKDYYLLPGDEFELNRKQMTALVKRESGDVKKSANEKTVKQDRVESSNWYMFQNQDLAQVLDQLATIYKVKIEYSKKDVSKINFIGRVDKSDAIEDILNDIALLNNLVVTREGNKYRITKK